MAGERYIGVDLGGSKIEGIVLDRDGKTIARQRVPTPSALGYDSIVEAVAALVENLPHSAAAGDRIGVGTPGAISRRSGRMKNSNTQCLNGRDLGGDLERRLARPVVLENDANCFTLAEALLGAGRGFDVVFGVIIGTGVGGGISVRGRVLNGPQSISGEWGHHSIDPQGPRCYCGARGCVETFIAGPSVEAAYAGIAETACEMSEIVRRAGRGETAAVRVMNDFLRNFGRALANVISILDPDAVVLGGGLSNVDQLYAAGVEQVARYVFNDELSTPILRNQLGDSAGVFGAALLTKP